MKLYRVDLHNFRSIRKARLDFPVGCQVLVGINETGKTNLLDALALLDPELEVQHSDTRLRGKREKSITEAYVRFIFRMGKQDLDAISSQIKARILTPSENAPLFTKNGDAVPLVDAIRSLHEGLYNVDLLDKTRGGSYWAPSQQLGTLEGWLHPRSPKPPNTPVALAGGKQVPLSDVGLAHSKLIADASLPLFEPASVDVVWGILGHQLASYVQSHLPEVIYWQHDDDYLLPPQVTLDQFQASPDGFPSLRNLFRLAGVSDIPTELGTARRGSLHDLRNLLESVSDKATKYLHRCWRECKGLTIELAPNGASLDISIHDRYNHYEMSQRSDGFKKFVSFLLMVSARQRTGELEDALILFDEPEIGLHPTGARHLMSQLLSLASRNLVVYSTHSIHMIDGERLDRHLIVKKKDEVTSFERAADSLIVDEEVLFRALGTSVFEVLKPSNILFEGWQDKHLFRVGVDRMRKANPVEFGRLETVGLVHARGVKGVSALAALLELASRNYIVVSDGDEPARQYQKDWSGLGYAGRWVRYDEVAVGKKLVTVEDFLALRAIQDAIEAIGDRFPSVPDVSLTEADRAGGTLRGLRALLSKAGVEKEVAEQWLRALKSHASEHLQGADIDTSYSQFLVALSEQLFGNPP